MYHIIELTIYPPYMFTWCGIVVGFMSTGWLTQERAAYCRAFSSDQRAIFDMYKPHHVIPAQIRFDSLWYGMYGIGVWLM
jgi:hypothetical protein